MTVTKERRRELCKLAAMEKDPYKLIQLGDEINSILQRASNAGDSTVLGDKLADTNGRTS